MQSITYDARYSIFKSACLALWIIASSVYIAIPGEASDSTLFRFIYTYNIEYILNIFSIFGLLTSIFFLTILSRAIRGDIIVSINDENVTLNFKREPIVVPRREIISLDSMVIGNYIIKNKSGLKAYLNTFLLKNPNLLLKNLREYIDFREFHELR